VKNKKNKQVKKARLPRVLVLEALGGSSSCIVVAGGEAIEVSPSFVSKACDAIDSHDWDALLLTGGGDVDPRMYGQRPRREVYGVSENRDLVETYALEVARIRDVPVLGICRGAQIINVEAGGTLRQHVAGHRGTEHPILSRKGTIMREFAGKSPVVMSLHHQRIEMVARGYEVSSRASDGTIESVESVSGRVLGVQFHPEMDDLEPYAQAIFRWLVCEAADRAGIPRPDQGEPTRSRISRGYRSSRYQTVTRDEKEGKRDPIAPTVHTPPKNRFEGVRRLWICPHCAMKFEGAGAQENRDDHVLLLHEGMVTKPTDVVPASLKRGSRREAGAGSAVRELTRETA
jgi:putative glutamine amidotransferase